MTTSTPTGAAPVKKRLTTSAMIASFADAGQRTASAPFGHALANLARACPNGAVAVFCPASANEAIIAEVVSRFFFGAAGTASGAGVVVLIGSAPRCRR